jgi:hypothetical protein
MNQIRSVIVIAAVAGAGACSGGPTAPGSPTIIESPAPFLPTGPSRQFDYAGQWSGTTSMGTTITFTVSPEQMVTALSVGYSGVGCSGTRTDSNLRLSLGNPYGALGAPQFDYTAGPPERPVRTTVVGRIDVDDVARGMASFRDDPDCGSSLVAGTWTATRR